jgi:hypothetical protein
MRLGSREGCHCEERKRRSNLCFCRLGKAPLSSIFWEGTSKERGAPSGRSSCRAQPPPLLRFRYRVTLMVYDPVPAAVL